MQCLRISQQVRIPVSVASIKWYYAAYTYALAFHLGNFVFLEIAQKKTGSVEWILCILSRGCLIANLADEKARTANHSKRITH